jgi:hypothetical protein
LLERLGWNHWTTTHGIRSAFNTWTTERTNHPREVVELCLSRVQGDALERAYQRGDIIDKRQQVMQAWANHCENESATMSNIVALRA